VSLVLAHLWTSTVVLLIALILARLLPLTARTRHALLLCALFKFAIPPLQAIGIDLTTFGRGSTGTIAIQWLGGPPTLRTLAAPAASRWPQALALAWVICAAVLALAWALARHRLVVSALHAVKPAAPREHAALTAARHRLGLRASVDVVRSTICEAPAVVRIVRPVIVLPDGGCDALDEAELESLLRHECAHVARRDNLLGLVESAIVAAFWFHPLVWIAQRAIATAREEACDETAAATADGMETYVSALSKICRAVLAPRLAGVSCMASAHLKERLHHLMRYELLRNRAFSHRFVVAVAAVALLAVTLGSGMHATPTATSNDPNAPFKLNFVVRPGSQPNMLVFVGRIVDAKTGDAVSQPIVTFPRGSNATLRADVAGRQFDVEVRDLQPNVMARLRVTENGIQQQDSTYLAVPQTDRPANSPYTGARISINLKDAEIKNVLDTFSRIIGAPIEYPPSLEGTVTLDVKDMPWDEAFDLILREQGLTFEHQGNKIVVKK